MIRKDLHLNLGTDMSRARAITLVKELFTQPEAMFLIYAAAQMVAQLSSAMDSGNLPPGMDLKVCEQQRDLYVTAMMKLWSTMSPRDSEFLRNTIHECYGLLLDVEIISTSPPEMPSPLSSQVH